jgi:hypothetical protein
MIVRFSSLGIFLTDIDCLHFLLIVDWNWTSSLNALFWD